MRYLALLALSVAALAVAGIASASRATTPTLVATVGPEDTITLTRAGHVVKALRAGTYNVTVKDLATDHNFHLYGPGVARTTSVGGTGSAHWTLKLRKGTYRFQCDPHANFMKGAFSVT